MRRAADGRQADPVKIAIVRCTVVGRVIVLVRRGQRMQASGTVPVLHSIAAKPLEISDAASGARACGRQADCARP